MMIKTFPFLITHVGPIILSMFFSLLSFHLPFSLLYHFMLACFQLFILSSSQNKIDITVFFSLRTFAYLFTFSFHVIIIFYSIQAFVIVYFHLFSFLLLFEVE